MEGGQGGRGYKAYTRNAKPNEQPGTDVVSIAIVKTYYNIQHKCYLFGQLTGTSTVELSGVLTVTVSESMLGWRLGLC